MSSNQSHFDILCLLPRDKPIYFVVPAFNPADLETTKYIIEEGSCPTNYLRDIAAVITDGDSDPHGLFEYVRTIERPDFIGKSHNPDEEWPKVIPEAFPKS